MAGKKPAKAIAGQTKQAAKDPAVYGQQTMFWGMKLAPSICPMCARKTVRGMVRVKQEKIYCSEKCAVASTPVEAV
jgi:hypothetical protein